MCPREQARQTQNHLQIYEVDIQLFNSMDCQSYYLWSFRKLMGCRGQLDGRYRMGPLVNLAAALVTRRHRRGGFTEELRGA
ncbi:MAG: hypothetical protein NVSMB6_05510 [Burkholderiaceae bacterium]